MFVFMNLVKRHGEKAHLRASIPDDPHLIRRGEEMKIPPNAPLANEERRVFERFG